MDARKLRNISADSFASRTQKGKAVESALDDGFTKAERDDLVGKTLVLVAWEISPGITGDYAEVWAIAEMNPGDHVKVKFQDGGRKSDGIPRTLAALTANGVREDVVCTITDDPYDFEDRNTGEWKVGHTYRFANADGKALTEALDDEPNF